NCLRLLALVVWMDAVIREGLVTVVTLLPAASCGTVRAGAGEIGPWQLPSSAAAHGGTGGPGGPAGATPPTRASYISGAVSVSESASWSKVVKKTLSA